MHRFGAAAAAAVVVILFMAIIIWLSKIVQAAPFVNRLLEKRETKEKRGGSLIGVFPPRIAVTHGKGRKRQSTHTKKYTCTIYKRVPRNDETPIHHTPLLFFFPFFSLSPSTILS